jgi:hypothetical protein
VPKLCRLRLNHPSIFMNPGWTTQYDLQVDLVAPTTLTLTLGLQPSKELPPPTAGKTDRALGTQQETPTGSTESCKDSFGGRAKGGPKAAAWTALRLDRLGACMEGALSGNPRPLEAEALQDELQAMAPSSTIDDAAATTTGHLINDSD